MFLISLLKILFNNLLDGRDRRCLSGIIGTFG
jgi:hypothetical protein